MTWTYRVFKEQDLLLEEDYFQIVEAFMEDGYDADLSKFTTEAAREVNGIVYSFLSAESYDALKWTLEQMLKALDKPVLVWDEKEKKYVNEQPLQT